MIRRFLVAIIKLFFLGCLMLYTLFFLNKLFDLEENAPAINDFLAAIAAIPNQNLNAAQIQEVYNNMCDIQGLGKYGMATKAKLLYFFNVSFEGKKCLILDSKVVKNLNRFDEFPGTEWAANQKCYPNYLSLMDELAMIHNVSSEQLEMFLFRYKE